MIINHPLLGPRDRQEFTYLGDACLIDRPGWQAEDEMGPRLRADGGGTSARRPSPPPPRTTVFSLSDRLVLGGVGLGRGLANGPCWGGVDRLR